MDIGSIEQHVQMWNGLGIDLSIDNNKMQPQTSIMQMAESNANVSGWNSYWLIDFVSWHIFEME